jgi:hypothetical protein
MGGVVVQFFTRLDFVHNFKIQGLPSQRYLASGHLIVGPGFIVIYIE